MDGNIEVVHVKDYGKKNKIIDNETIYIYCGRPSKYGNPYSMRQESQREEVVNRFRSNETCKEVVKRLKVKLLSNPQFKNIKLGCFCSPRKCHCDVIKEWLEDDDV
ncbi:MAG: DUF4326 domain-containing protein [Gammaproteobacteria bacterium]|nr:DUF4326 domain-containing protein [Gammaproteobacteria bacterium]